MNYPIVLEKADKHLMGLDLASKLMQDRIIMLDEPITDEFASQIITQLLYLKHNTDSQKPKPITIFVKGPGGYIYPGLGIYDMIENVKSAGIVIKTRGIGWAASMQSLLLSAGSPGERKVFSNTTIMIHQPSGGTKGTVTNMKIDLKESERLKEKMIDIYIKHGASEEIKDLMERDYWMSAERAVELGLIDGIL